MHASDDCAAEKGARLQKIYLVLSYLYLLPWFARHCVRCELPLRPFLDVNPELPLGGLPIASKLSRYGSDPPYLPSLTVDATTPRSSIADFAATHSFPLVVKPLFGAHSRDIRKVSALDDIVEAASDEAMIVQPYVDAPKEYGINIGRVGPRVKIYGLTEVTLRSVWGNGKQCLSALAAQKYGPEAAEGLEHGDWVPPEGRRVPLQVAADAGRGSSFHDVTDQVTPTLRAACQSAADEIGLRFGRFDVRADSLEALQDGNFFILEVNGSPSMDLTLYDEQYGLNGTIERLRAHWSQFFHQAQPRQSPAPNTWRLLSTLLWFVLAPRECAASFRHEVDDGELTPGA
ncbi:MAG: RimK family alpha-L-glutamate ligase [Salinibacter sp.]